MVSIVMPVKNTALYLQECLDSIREQTYTNWELIAINDHSTDESLAILEAYGQKDNRIIVLNNIGKGIIDALKLAYQNTSGDFITRMDSDDIMPERKLELMRDQLVQYPKAVATGKIKYIAKNLSDGYKKYETWINALVEKNSQYQEVYRECVIPSPAWMMKRESFDEIGAFDPNTYPEDYDLTFRMYKAKIVVRSILELVHIWRDYQERTSRNDIHYSFNSFEVLKTDYFLKIDYDSAKILVLWGGGKKGKKIAKLLQEHQIDFTWACNNDKKIGQEIYGAIMQNIDSVFDTRKKYQTLIAVANPEDQIEIKKDLKNKPYIDAYWFC